MHSGLTEERATGSESKAKLSTMSDNCEGDWFESKVHDDSDCSKGEHVDIAEMGASGRRGKTLESPVSSSQSCCLLLPNSSPSNPSAPSRASFTESSLQGAPQMNTCTTTTRYFQLLFSLIEYTSEVTRLHANNATVTLC